MQHPGGCFPLEADEVGFFMAELGKSPSAKSVLAWVLADEVVKEEYMYFFLIHTVE